MVRLFYNLPMPFSSSKSNNQSTPHPKYLLINTNSSTFGTTLLFGSNQLFILMMGMLVNIDNCILDSGVGNRVFRLWNGGLRFGFMIYDYVFSNMATAMASLAASTATS